MTMPFKILLTGAAGRLGAAIRKLDCHQYGAAVEWVSLDTNTRGDSAVREGSFLEEALLDELIPGCDAVIHTAAMHGHFYETHTAAQFTEVNVVGLIKLLEACRKHNVKRFVFSSTMEVQIGRIWDASGMAVVDEDTAPNPDWIYPANKLAGEQFGKFYYKTFGIEFIALRYMGFDYQGRLDKHFLARTVMTQDVAAANLLAATKPGLGYEALNIGAGSPLTNKDIAQAMTDAWSVVEKYWPGASAVLQANEVTLEHEVFWPVTRIEKAKFVLGWEPQFTFESYLRSLGWEPSV